MVRAVLAVIGSYVLMFVLLFLCFTGVYLTLGVNFAFRPGVYDVSHRWLAMALAVNFVVPAIAGLVCAAIAKGGRAPIAFAVLVLAVGLLLGALKGQPQGPNVRTGDVPNIEAMQHARNPVWAVFGMPFVAAIGVLVGSRLRRKS
ncbi:MAG TPA: hypothetical protein VHE60_06305 [Pyrinomonadaceae bacterium]|nr:hypothetical protein [Pyrinomonadaceae bacterium]